MENAAGPAPRGTVYYLEIGTAEELIALHSWRSDGGSEPPAGVEVISGWSSEEPYLELVRGVALEQTGEDVWVVIWAEGVGRGRALRALAAWQGGQFESTDLSARREKQLLYALHVGELERDGYQLNWDTRHMSEADVRAPEPDPGAAAVQPEESAGEWGLGHNGASDSRTDYSELWAAVADLLNEEVESQQRRAYLRLVSLQAIVADAVLLAVPDPFTRDVVETQLRPAITEAFSRQLGRPIKVIVVVRPAPRVGGAATPPAAVALFSIPEPRGSHARHDSGAIRVPSEPNGPSRLIPRYTFETFVIGSSNRFAHAAAVAVAESPARAYNPLVIYAIHGLGLDHLLHAIGNYALALGTARSARYVTAEEFTNDFINSLRDDKQSAFQRRYRDLDILLFDGIQHLENRERTQEEFFHTFNTLHNANKQIVITSDRKPKDLTGLEDRLRTRLEWGLLADITPPDTETRIAILQHKAAQERLLVPPDVLAYIAQRIKHSIRELEGALIRVTAFASLNRAAVDLAMAEEVLRDFIPDGSGSDVTIDQIIDAASEYYSVHEDDLRGHSRTREFILARQVAMYLCRELTDLSLPRIGQAFGGRDHTTVMHADRKIRQQIAERRTLFNQIAELTNRIKTGATRLPHDGP